MVSFKKCCAIKSEKWSFVALIYTLPDILLREKECGIMSVNMQFLHGAVITWIWIWTFRFNFVFHKIKLLVYKATRRCHNARILIAVAVEKEFGKNEQGNTLSQKEFYTLFSFPPIVELSQVQYLPLSYTRRTCFELVWNGLWSNGSIDGFT